MKNLIMAIVLLLLTSCTSLVKMYSSNNSVAIIHNGQVGVMKNADQVTFKVLDAMQKSLSKNGSIWVEVPYRYNSNNGKTLQEFLQKK